jgi:hypothetical protein
MTEVKLAGHVRRRHDYHKWFADRVTGWGKIAGGVPPVVEPVLHGLRIE